ADVRRQLTHVEQDARHGRVQQQGEADEQRSAAEATKTLPDAARGAIDNRQAPGNRTAQRLPYECGKHEDQHAEPQMTLVVQREIACAEVAVRGEVEQDQPTEAGEENKTGIGNG